MLTVVLAACGLPKKAQYVACEIWTHSIHTEFKKDQLDSLLDNQLFL